MNKPVSTDAEIVARMRDSVKGCPFPGVYTEMNAGADLIEQQAARIKELEEIVGELLHRIDGSMIFITTREKINSEYGPGWIKEATDRARAALEGK